MSYLITITPADFEQHVHDCLLQLYNFSFLQSHPFVEALVPEVKGAKRVQVFREAVVKAVESLRPSPDFDPLSKAARVYNILNLRYIKQQKVQQVLTHLSLSERQFYREHTKAIHSLMTIFWERLTGEAIVLPVSEPEEEAPSVESEIQRVRSDGSAVSIQLRSLIDDTVSLIHSLNRQHSLDVDNCVGETFTLSDADGMIVRQIFILLLSELAHFAPQVSLHVSAEIVNRTCQIAFKVSSNDKLPLQTIVETTNHQETIVALLRSINGTVTCYTDIVQDIAIVFEIPFQETIVLVVDDNPNIIHLFRHYIAGHPYQLLTASDSEQAISMARRAHPQLIILDVLMPEHDGWEILQNLKNHPVTCHFPVLICSVLNLPQVAISLGANAYLPKPPGQTEFLKALAHWSTP